MIEDAAVRNRSGRSGSPPAPAAIARPRNTMIAIDEIRRRLLQVLPGLQDNPPPVPSPGADHEPPFFARLRGVPTVEVGLAGAVAGVSPFFIPNDSLDGPVASIHGR